MSTHTLEAQVNYPIPENKRETRRTKQGNLKQKPLIKRDIFLMKPSDHQKPTLACAKRGTSVSSNYNINS